MSPIYYQFQVIIIATILYSSQADGIQEMRLEFGENKSLCTYKINKTNVANRIPRTIIEVNCEENECCPKSRRKCVQLFTFMEVGYVNSSEKKNIPIKSGCACVSMNSYSSDSKNPPIS